MTELEAAFVRSRRIAHLATADATARPHVVPICYAFDGTHLYTSVDEKPKRVAAARLRRLRNILENPQVAVVVDRYDEDWLQLGWVLIEGRAEQVENPAERARAIDLLREKYPQYRTMALEARPLVRITPEKVSSWGRLETGESSLT